MYLLQQSTRLVEKFAKTCPKSGLCRPWSNKQEYRFYCPDHEAELLHRWGKYPAIKLNLRSRRAKLPSLLAPNVTSDICAPASSPDVLPTNRSEVKGAPQFSLLKFSTSPNWISRSGTSSWISLNAIGTQFVIFVASSSGTFTGRRMRKRVAPFCSFCRKLRLSCRNLSRAIVEL